MRLLQYIFLSFLLYSCGVAEEEEDLAKKIYISCSQELSERGECSRFMDRTIYYGRFVPGETNLNDPFHVNRAIEIFSKLSRETDLGVNYFNFVETDANLLEPISEDTQMKEDDFKSFFQIWPPEKFSKLLRDLPIQSDPNAILVLNQANKKEFYIIFKSSCFESNNVDCTQDSLATFTSNSGLEALFGRQLARLVGGQVDDCSLYPNSAMCAEYPNDNQWSINNQSALYSIINNGLEAINLNPDFYEEFFID